MQSHAVKVGLQERDLLLQERDLLLQERDFAKKFKGWLHPEKSELRTQDAISFFLHISQHL